MKLNNEKAQTAWEDYKAFLEGLGYDFRFNPNAMKGIEQAYKMGFVQGEQAHTTAAKEAPKPKGSPKRNEQELAQDAKRVRDFLKLAGGVMSTSRILQAVNRSGGHWKANSVTGHMKRAMKREPEIVRVGPGLYTFKAIDNK